MNREVLFRGFHKDDNGEDQIFLNEQIIKGYWCFGYYVNSAERHIIMSNSAVLYDIIPETIGQFTGRADKNGYKIFEGDMLKSYYDKPGIIKWNDEIGAFQVKGIPSQTMKRCYQMEVIGNIYDKEVKE